MELLDAIYKRKSVRDFLPDKMISEDIIKKIIDVGIHAPSGKNGQPWNFVVIDNIEMIGKLSEYSEYKKSIMNASCLIFVYLDKIRSYDLKKDILAIGACIENMLLAACDYEIACCWNGDILKNNDKVNDILMIPSSYELISVICLGIENIKITRFLKKTIRMDVDSTIIKWIR